MELIVVRQAVQHLLDYLFRGELDLSLVVRIHDKLGRGLFGSLLLKVCGLLSLAHFCKKLLLGCFDELVLVRASKPCLTEFGIYHNYLDWRV